MIFHDNDPCGAKEIFNLRYEAINSRPLRIFLANTNRFNGLTHLNTVFKFDNILLNVLNLFLRILIYYHIYILFKKMINQH